VRTCEQTVTQHTILPPRTRSRPHATIVHLGNKFLLIAALVLPPLVAASEENQLTTKLRLKHCFAELDDAVQSFENGRADIARKHLELLTQSCHNVPHLYHNLGALALLNKDWDAAIEFFKQSLSLDPRASMTNSTLSSVYRYKAALAYQKALKLEGPDPALPIIQMQTSALTNSQHPLHNDAIEGEHRSGSRARAIEDVKFELFSWWTAQQRHDLGAYFAFYASGAHPAAFKTEDTWRAHWAAVPTEPHAGKLTLHSHIRQLADRHCR